MYDKIKSIDKVIEYLEKMKTRELSDKAIKKICLDNWVAPIKAEK